jgi:hypothetical protein
MSARNAKINAPLPQQDMISNQHKQAEPVDA